MSNLSDDDNGHTYDLILPFVCVVSVGGPYDDDAFVAGWRLALLDRQLAAPYGLECATTIRNEERRQADLIAMRHGWSLETEGPEPADEWLNVTFRRDNP
jgi:hypothetical protein